MNGKDLLLATHEEAAGALKTAGDTVELVVQYRPDGKLFPTVSIAIRNYPTEYFKYSTTDNT